MKAILLFFLIVLSLVSLSPKAQATSVEKYPSETTQIVVGWLNPTYAYADDDLLTSTENYANAEQEYTGFAFNFGSSDSIQNVLLKVEWASYLMTYSSCWIQFELDTLVYDGSNWITYSPIPQTTFSSDAFAYVETSATTKAMNITATATKTVLNDLHIRLKWYMGSLLDDDIILVDFISVIVFYTSGTSGADTFPDGFIAGALLIGTVGLVGVLVVKKRS